MNHPTGLRKNRFVIALLFVLTGLANPLAADARHNSTLRCPQEAQGGFYHSLTARGLSCAAANRVMVSFVTRANDQAHPFSGNGPWNVVGYECRLKLVRADNSPITIDQNFKDHYTCVRKNSRVVFDAHP